MTAPLESDMLLIHERLDNAVLVLTLQDNGQMNLVSHAALTKERCIASLREMADHLESNWHGDDTPPQTD